MATDIILQFVYSPGPNSDMRTFSVFMTGEAGEIEIYKVNIEVCTIELSH